jgi:hypothetical protein
LSAGDFARDYAFGVDAKPIDLVPEQDRRTFRGYHRANGRVGTRNYVALISTVNCSAHVTRQIAQHFTPDRLAPYPNVDGLNMRDQPQVKRTSGGDYLETENGVVFDVRMAPREVQQRAFDAGLIPFIPADRPAPIATPPAAGPAA